MSVCFVPLIALLHQWYISLLFLISFSPILPMKSNFLIQTALCLVLFLCLTQNAWTQVITEDDLLEPSALLRAELSGQSNESYVRQVGNKNEAEVIQTQVGSDGINLARLLQSGEYNLAIIRQEGFENQLALIQNGNQNFYELTLQGGNKNNIAILQQGSENTIIQQLVNTSRLDIELIQKGNNNEIIQVLEGVSDKSYKIIQEGDGLRLTIRQSDF